MRRMDRQARGRSVAMIANFVAVTATFGALAPGCKERAKPKQAEPDVGDGSKGQRDGGHGPEPVSLSVADALTQKGPSTFIVGTSGDERSDQSIAAQAALFRSMALTDATIVNDSSIDVAAGPSAWPKNPVVYGGAHVNSVIAELTPTLPIQVGDGRLAIGADTGDGRYVVGAETLTGDDLALMAVIPARAADSSGPGYPEFVWYAGTGTPGIGEINAASRGLEQVLVVDRFAPLRVGRWIGRGAEPDALTMRAIPRGQTWQTEVRTLTGYGGGKAGKISLHTPAKTPLGPDRSAILDAAMRGLSRTVRRLHIEEPADVHAYLYASEADKQAATGKGGDGHAVVYARTLHMVAGSDAGFESLAGHEGAHVLLYEAWGQPGSALLAEGVAVWAAGSYGGAPLAELLRTASAGHPPVTELLGGGFRRMPEAEAYALAATLVDVLIEAVGIEGVAEHLWSADGETWAAKLATAGTSAEAIEAALAARRGAR